MQPRPSDAERVIVTVNNEPLDVEHFELSIQPPAHESRLDVSGLLPAQAITATFETTFAVDKPTYDKLAGGMTYTVSMTRGGAEDPSQRRVRTFRELLRQMRDIIVYEFRKAGKMLPPVVTITVPNCRLVDEATCT